MRIPLVIAHISLLAMLTMSGCALPGKTVASLDNGSDSAAVNAGRGRADAQLTKEQLEQQRRQRQNVKEEMELEDMKRERTMKNISGAVGILGSILGAYGAYRGYRR